MFQEHDTFNIFTLLRIFRTNALNEVVKMNKEVWKTNKQKKKKQKKKTRTKVRLHVC